MELSQQSFSVYINQMISLQQKYKLYQQVVEAVDFQHKIFSVHGISLSFALTEEKNQQLKLVNFEIVANILKRKNIYISRRKTYRQCSDYIQ